MADGFYLSPEVRADKAALLEHLVDPEIAHNTLRLPFPYTAQHADEWLSLREKEACDPEKLFGIREPNGYLVGAIGLGGTLPPGPDEAEFGYWMAKPCRNRGLMTRAIVAYTEHAFARLGFKRLIACPFPWNIASQRALEKAGYRRECLLSQHVVKNGVTLDAILYARERG